MDVSENRHISRSSSSSGGNSDSDSGKSEFDEEHARLKPPPIKIDLSRVVQVYAIEPPISLAESSEKNNTTGNQTKKTGEVDEINSNKQTITNSTTQNKKVRKRGRRRNSKRGQVVNVGIPEATAQNIEKENEPQERILNNSLPTRKIELVPKKFTDIPQPHRLTSNWNQPSSSTENPGTQELDKNYISTEYTRNPQINTQLPNLSNIQQNEVILNNSTEHFTDVTIPIEEEAADSQLSCWRKFLRFLGYSF